MAKRKYTEERRPLSPTLLVVRKALEKLSPKARAEDYAAGQAARPEPARAAAEAAAVNVGGSAALRPAESPECRPGWGCRGGALGASGPC